MDKQLKIFIIDKDSTSRALIESYLGDIDFISEVKIVSNFEEYVISRSEEDSNLIIIDVSEDTDILLEGIRVI